jgi:Sec-independent protein translocase protein TatA
MLGDLFGVDSIIVLVIVLVVLFGGAAIPKLARNLGSAKTEFEKGLKESAKGADKSEDKAGDTPEAAVKARDEAGTTGTK